MERRRGPETPRGEILEMVSGQDQKSPQVGNLELETDGQTTDIPQITNNYPPNINPLP